MPEIAYVTPTGVPVILPEEWKSEDHLNAFCYQWLTGAYPFLRGLVFHVPNELPVAGKAGIIHRSQNKSKGVVAGIPDFVIVWPKVCGLEGKLPGKKPSEAQDEIHRIWIVVGGRPIFLYDSFEGFRECIKIILDKNPTPARIYDFLSK